MMIRIWCLGVIRRIKDSHQGGISVIKSRKKQSSTAGVGTLLNIHLSKSNVDRTNNFIIRVYRLHSVIAF